MINIQFGKHNQTQQPVVVVTTQEVADPLKLLRGLKQAFPGLWQQVHLELVVSNGHTNRLLVPNDPDQTEPDADA